MWGILAHIARNGKVKWLFLRVFIEFNSSFTSHLEEQISFSVYISAYILAQAWSLRVGNQTTDFFFKVLALVILSLRELQGFHGSWQVNSARLWPQADPRVSLLTEETLEGPVDDI